MKREPEFIRRMPVGHGYAGRGDEAGALAIGDELVDFFGRLALCLAVRDPRATGGETGQRGAIF